MDSARNEVIYRFIDRNWRQVEFDGKSLLDPQSRHPLLLVHGQPGCGTKWGRLPMQLDQAFDVYSYDRPGWGRNRFGAKGVEGNAADLLAIASKVQKLTGSAPIAMAYSYGAAIALRTLELDASVFLSTLLIAPAMSPLAINRYDRIFTNRALGPLTALITSIFSTKYIGTTIREILHSTKSLRLEAINLLTELAEMPSSDLSQLQVAILAGTADFVTPPESIYDGAKKFSLTSIEWVNGGSHLLPWKNSDAIVSFAERALSHLK